MNNFGRAALLLGLSAALTFTGPEFFQAGTGIAVVQAAEETAETSENGGSSDSAESENTTEKTTEATEAATTEEPAAEASTETAKTEEAAETTGHSSEHTGSTTESSEGGSTAEKKQEEKNSEEDTAKSKKQTVSSKEEAEIKTSSVKDIKDEMADEEAPEGSDKTGTFIPKIYNDTRLAMKNNKEYIAGYVYFNQGDSAWNQNGYCIARAGCGPTSMAVVITSLTGEWVTPLDTAIWGYQHGYYSSAGSAHEMIPAMAAAYGLQCEGAGTDYQAIKKALKAGKPVVALMGPGYFTRGGHFMVLVAIDDNDNVTVADVGSRARSAYKYRLSDIIAQSKGASAGGPFWVMSYNKKQGKKASRKKAIKNITKSDLKADFADTTYVNLKGQLPAELRESADEEVTVKKVVSILTMSTGDSMMEALGNGTFAPVKEDKAVISETVSSTDAAAEPAGSGSDGIDATVGNRGLAITIKQDIAKRQWEKKIPLSRLENYMEGTIDHK